MIQCFILTCYQNSFTALHPKHFDRPHLDILSYSKQRHLTILKRCQYSLMKRDRGKRLGPTSPFRFLIVINAPDQNTLIQQCVCVMEKKDANAAVSVFSFSLHPPLWSKQLRGKMTEEEEEEEEGGGERNLLCVRQSMEELESMADSPSPRSGGVNLEI